MHHVRTIFFASKTDEYHGCVPAVEQNLTISVLSDSLIIHRPTGVEREYRIWHYVFTAVCVYPAMQSGLKFP